MKIHQYHYSISQGDAISNQMFLIQKTLSEKGIQGELYCGDKIDTAEIEKGNWLLIHHSQGNPHLENLLSLKIKKALVYHNVTPAEYFSHDSLLNHLCTLGRKQLSLFPEKVDRSFADSIYNAEELGPLSRQTEILPLLDLKPLKPQIAKSREKLKALFVGRITPHKNQARLIEIARELENIKTPVSLAIVGGSDPIYQTYLNALTRNLKVEDSVDFVGKVSDSELEMHYENADFFICMSLHEGFCIPLVEAMRYQIPVFALKSAAVPDTLGSAAIQFDDDNAFDVACTIKAVMENPKWKNQVIQSQNQRYESLLHFQNKNQIAKQLEALCKDN